MQMFCNQRCANRRALRALTAAFFCACSFQTAGALAPSAIWMAESNQAGAQFGAVVATAGDVNKDGYSDVLVGVPYYDDGETDEGAVFLYLGSATGTASTPAWSAEGEQAGANFGAAVATAGDINGDGYSDFLVGAPRHDYSAEIQDSGRVYVYYGGPALGTLGPVYEATQAGEQFGSSVATAGDTNGDSISEIIVGAPDYTGTFANEGAAFLYIGSVRAWTATGGAANARFGCSVSTAGDVNGDSYADVIIGASGANDNDGTAYVYHGTAMEPYLNAASGAFPATGPQLDSRFGASVSTAGDVNGDGYADVIVGAPYGWNGQAEEGQAYVYYGSSSGIVSNRSWAGESNQISAYCGASVAIAGDVNGDGFSDVIVGAPFLDNGQTDEGRAYVYCGNAEFLGTRVVWDTGSTQANVERGRVVALVEDVNGDGYADALVSEPLYDNGQSDEGRIALYQGSSTGLSTAVAKSLESNQAGAQFGLSAASAGDVNGDGYADIIIGAPFYDNTGTDEGKAYLYYGSNSGLASSPAWTYAGDQDNANFGAAVGCAGDINGDGFADIFVAAPGYDAGEKAECGRVCVFYGSATGLAAVPNWTKDGGAASIQFGKSAASSGDVNGDGFSDFVVGDPGYSNGQNNEGRVYLFLGSAAGLGSDSAWVYESDQADAQLGACVAAAGDVNGDGFADIAAGAPLYDAAHADDGAVFAFYGSATGPGAGPNWINVGGQAGAAFGCSISRAGDINGDGYADLMVGAQSYDNGQVDEGAAYLYAGSASGLSSPAWTCEINQADASYGASVAGGGDVNGDGYADALVGAPLFGNGRAYCYYGNGHAGVPKSLRPRQLCVTAPKPISRLGMADKVDQVKLGAVARTPFGRASGYLEFEIKPFGTPFDGQGTAKILLNPNPGERTQILNLPHSQLYHWRIRSLYKFPYQQAGRWFSIPWNGATEADFRLKPALVVSSITPESPGPTNADDFTYTVVFSQAAVNFNNATDLSVTASGIQFGGFTISGGPISYSVRFNNITGNGTLAFIVNTDSDIVSMTGQPLYVIGVSPAVTIDNAPPQVTLTSVESDPTEASPIPVTLVFSEPVAGFTADDLTASGGNIGALSGSGETYTFDVTPSGVGDVSVAFGAAKVTDLAGNANIASEFSRLYLTPDSVIVTDPGSGDTLRMSSANAIRWISGSAVGDNVKIRLYNGLTFIREIAGSAPDTGVYSWIVPQDLTPDYDYAVRVEAADDATQYGLSDEFGIAASPITITSPNGGEVWSSNTYKYIRWTSSPGVGSTVKIKLWKAGASYRWISGGAANSGSFKWKVPADLPNADDYTVQIYSSANTSMVDFSDAPFSIAELPFRLVYPNGGDRFMPGDPVRINWTYQPGADPLVKLQLWKGETRYAWIRDKIDVTKGFFNWTVPAGVPEGNDYNVRLASCTDSSMVDASDNYFSISPDRLRLTSPNGGEILGLNSRVNITWDTQGAVGGDVRIKLFDGSQYTWISGGTPNDGSFAWTVPAGTPVGSNYTIQIYSTTNTSIVDYSDATFTIAPPPITVVSPNGGETFKAGARHDITWTCIGSIGDQVKIKLYRGGTFSWVSGGTPNDGLFNWLIPTTLPPGSDYKIQIYTTASYLDYSDTAFTITAP